MAVIKSRCPSCHKILKLKTRAALGKRVPCPGCEKPFIVEVYEAPVLIDEFLEPEDEGETFDYADYEGPGNSARQDYDEYTDDEYTDDEYADDEYADDEYADDEYADDEYDAPPRRTTSRSGSSSRSSRGQSGKKKNSRKKKKKSGLPAWAPLALIGLAALLAVGGVVGVIIAFLPGPGDSSNVISLAWLPGDADGYAYIEPAAMMKAAVLTPLRENAQFKEVLNEEIPGGPGLKLTDINSMTIAIIQAEDQAGIPGEGNPLAALEGKSMMLIVLRVSRSLTESDLQVNTSRKEHNGREYYSAGGNSPAMYLIDPTTLMIGDEALLTAAIDQGATEPRAEWMDFAEAGQQFFIAMKVPAVTGPGATDEAELAAQQAKAGYVGISLNSNVDLKAGLNCAASEDAALLKSKLEESLTEAKAKMDEQGQVPPQFTKLVDIARQVVNSVSASSSGSILTVSGSIPGEVGPAVAELADNPIALLGMGAMLGGGIPGFGGGGNPPSAAGQQPPVTINPGTTTLSNNGNTTPQISGFRNTGGGSVNPLTGALDAARKSQSKNNLKQLMLGAHNYHDVHGKFPQSAITGPDGKTTHSWRVALLPFIGQKKLYDQYQLNEPWDSPANQAVLNQMPAAFRHPNDFASSTNAAYFGLVGPDTAMGDSSRQARLRDITDGTANTIFLVEARRKIPWTKPEDIAYTTQAPIPQFGGYHNGGFHASLADGSVRFLADSLDQNTLRNAINARDGNAVNLNVGIQKAAGLKTAGLHTQPVPFEQHSRWGLESVFRHGRYAVPGRAGAENPANRTGLPTIGQFIKPGRSPG